MDVFFDFWFNFVCKCRNLIETGKISPDKEELNNYFGKWFEFFVMENIPRMFPKFNLVKKGWGRILL